MRTLLRGCFAPRMFVVVLFCCLCFATQAAESVSDLESRLAQLKDVAIGTTCKINGQVVSLAGGTAQFFNQLIGISFTMVFAGVTTYILLKLVNALVGLRVSEENETVGLDLSEHGESAYND